MDDALFAVENGIRIDQARQLIRKYGNDREAMEWEARRMPK